MKEEKVNAFFYTAVLKTYNWQSPQATKHNIFNETEHYCNAAWDGWQWQARNEEQGDELMQMQQKMMVCLGRKKLSAVKMSRKASLPLQHTNYPWTLREHTNYPWTLTEHTNYPWTLTEEQATVLMNTDITHKSTHGHWQNTQKYLWTLTEHTKVLTDTRNT